MSGRPDARTSAVVNAVTVLVLALLPLTGSDRGVRVDHREQRPWGCQTCPIPEAPAQEAPVETTL